MEIEGRRGIHGTVSFRWKWKKKRGMERGAVVQERWCRSVGGEARRLESAEEEGEALLTAGSADTSGRRGPGGG